MAFYLRINKLELIGVPDAKTNPQGRGNVK